MPTPVKDVNDKVMQSNREYEADSESAPYGPVGETWAPILDREVFGAGTDAHRLGTMPIRQFYADDIEDVFYDSRANDISERHSVESVSGTFVGYQSGSGKNIAPDPRLKPPAETRITSRLAPRSYFFTRPFMQGFARRLNGIHFSMADHRRTYPVLGMEPLRRARNTYRIDPVPWDEQIVDIPTNSNNANDVRGSYISTSDIIPVRDRSMRLM